MKPALDLETIKRDGALSALLDRQHSAILTAIHALNQTLNGDIKRYVDNMHVARQYMNDADILYAEYHRLVNRS